MLVNEQSLALHETIYQMGFDSVEDFAVEKAKETLLKEVSICTQRMSFFSNKYGVDYTEFCKNFHSLPQSIVEKEEDSAEWNAELKQLDILMNRLSKIG